MGREGGRGLDGLVGVEVLPFFWRVWLGGVVGGQVIGVLWLEVTGREFRMD